MDFRVEDDDGRKKRRGDGLNRRWGVIWELWNLWV